MSDGLATAGQVREPPAPMPLTRLALLTAALLAGCGPAVQPPPDAGRNTGDPAGTWKEQNQEGEASTGLAFDMPEAGAGGFSVLAANVGNIDFTRCDTSIYKLCAFDQEQFLTRKFQKLAPDIALLGEVMAPGQCEALSASVPEWHVCHPSHRQGELDQARRLLGPGYTISCEPRRGYECIGVRTGFAAIEGCDAGATCRTLSRSVPAVAGCDDGFTLSAVTAVIDGQPVDLIVGHPPSGFGAAEAKCRRAYLPGALEPKGTAGSLREAPRALFGGDLNTDVYRSPADEDVAYFRSRVRFSYAGDGGAFALHSGLPEHDPPYWSALLVRRTWDHVLSEGLVGRCTTLGAAKDRPPIDGAVGPDVQRLDHYAQYCVLSLAP